MHSKLNKVHLALFAGVALVLTSCGNQGGAAAKKPVVASSAAVSSGGTTTGGTSGGGTTVTVPLPTPTPTATAAPTSAPYSFTLSGLGNHPQHLCIKATTKLKLRVKPLDVNSPLWPPYPNEGYMPRYSDSTKVYDATKVAAYTKFRVRLSTPSMAVDHVATLNQYSPTRDYSGALGQFTVSYPNDEMPTKIPEYTDKWIWGASPYDGLCTFYETYMGKCSNVSAILRLSEVATCPAGTQKVMVTDIVSNYPCTNPKLAWCGSQDMHYVLDYEPWSIVVEAVTEGTTDFGQ